MLRPLVNRMINEDPAQRPSAAEALAEFTKIRQGVGVVQNLWRARKRSEPFVVGAVLDTWSLVSRICLLSASRSDLSCSALQPCVPYFQATMLRSDTPVSVLLRAAIRGFMYLYYVNPGFRYLDEWFSNMNGLPVPRSVCARTAPWPRASRLSMSEQLQLIHKYSACIINRSHSHFQYVHDSPTCSLCS